MRKNALLAALISLLLSGPVIAQETGGGGIGSSGAIPGGVAITTNGQTAVVEPPSTTPAATDPALATALSPNSAGLITLGTAGAPSSQVMSVQGVTNGTPAPIAGNVGGKTVTVCTALTVTTGNAYGINFVTGGLISFPAAFTATGSGILQGITVTMKDQETNGWTLVVFASQPTSTTWTDAAVAAINAADVTKVRASIPLASNIQLASTLFSVQYAFGLGIAMAPGATTLYAVLLSNAALTNNFAGAGDVQVCVNILDDI